MIAETTEGGARLAWPDATRGLAVLAVVLYHSLIWNQRDLAGGLVQPWGWVNAALSQLRMPVLLSISGLFAARTLSQGWPSGGAALRFVSNYYLYAVWVLLYFTFYASIPARGLVSDIGTTHQLVRQLLLPDTTLWYILVLAVFPLVITAAHTLRLQPWMVLGLGLAARVVGQVVVMPDAVGKPLRTFVFFAVGVYLAPRLHAFADTRATTAALYGAFFVVLVVVLIAAPDGPARTALATMASLASIPAAIAGVAHLCRWRPIAAGGAFIGSRTLPIYLLHVPILAVVLILARHHEPLGDFARSGTGAYAMPVVTAAVAVTVSMVLHQSLRKVPGNVLLALPRTAADRVRSRFSAVPPPVRSTL